jgi:hypothetical protein
VYVITFPAPAEKASLYVFDAKLTVKSLDVSAHLAYFDLQYSLRQQTFFGITVSSTYGRVLSRFHHFGSNVSFSPIRSLPDLWFVNASTFDAQTDRYFGLLNHFPNTPNFTSRQKLAVGEFSTATEQVVFLDLVAQEGSPSGMIHFLSWSEPAQMLFGLAQMDNVTVHFVVVEPANGTYWSFFDVSPVVVGPMFASNTTMSLYACLHNAISGARLFGQMDIPGEIFNILQVYGDNLTVAAVSRLDFW